MHSLLRSDYFAKWPLRIRFFCLDVYRVWRLWNDRVDASLPDSKIILDGDCSTSGSGGADAAGSINELQVDYTKLEVYLEKSIFLLGDADGLQCQICNVAIVPHIQQIVVCPHASCRGTSHLLCLSSKFLESKDDSDFPIPTQGACPLCKEIVTWPLMMQELTVRNRAEREARLILRRKEKREHKKAVKSTTEKDGDKGAQGRMSSVEPTFNDPSDRAQDTMCQLDQDDIKLDDNWYGETDIESESETAGREKNRSPRASSRLEIVIEDSEWDDAELIE